MSATGRSNVRHPDDYYSTPAWCTRAILPHVRPDRPPHSPPRVIDPCAGTGAILDVVRDAWSADVRGFELDEERARVAQVQSGDALFHLWPPGIDLVLTNPPYSLAEDFIVRAESQCPDVDRAFLLRINFLGSQRRASFHKTHPSDLFVLPKRPSFTNGGTDATEYAWFVFGPKRGGRWAILDLSRLEVP